MIGSVEYYSNVNQSLQTIYEAHWETGNEINSKIGNTLREAIRRELDKEKTHWHIEYVNGKRRFVYKNITRSIGDIVNRQGVLLTVGLRNMIQSRTYSTTGTTVVAAAMKSGTTEIRKDGVVVDRARVSTVGQGTINILQKINYGLNSGSNQVNKVGNSFDWQGEKSRPNFKGKHTRGRGFVERGKASAQPKVMEYLGRGFKDALSRRKTTIVKPVKVA